MKKRHMKKWIPNSQFYCYNSKEGICRWLIDLTESKSATKFRERYCDYKEYCDVFLSENSCKNCNVLEGEEIVIAEAVTYCAYLKVFEIGQYPLGDMCKICKEHINSKKSKNFE